MDPVGLLLGGAFKDSVDFTNPNLCGKNMLRFDGPRANMFQKMGD